MNDMQQTLVKEHIDDLFRDGEALRAERQIRGADRSFDVDVGARVGPDGSADRRGVRVRVGHWLIGVGTAVAGPNGHSNGPAKHAT